MYGAADTRVWSSRYTCIEQQIHVFRAADTRVRSSSYTCMDQQIHVYGAADTRIWSSRSTAQGAADKTLDADGRDEFSMAVLPRVGRCFMTIEYALITGRNGLQLVLTHNRRWRRRTGPRCDRAIPKWAGPKVGQRKSADHDYCLLY